MKQEIIAQLNDEIKELKDKIKEQKDSAAQTIRLLEDIRSLITKTISRIK